ncbi:conserved hypothetical protein [Ricinus communis]|uniref:DUF761 domain-containing protein n=1 Tax=Ricinus communis TaxID=3988 RepID=B9T5E5_RICCO|nr:conserved hypothetical protein [Ricinus communis]|eukprot:XP_002533464.1 uncharacterized protein LOC8280431 [Ricinus communis]
MQRSSLRKKLQPAKKAWKRLRKTVESKLNSFNFSKAINVIKNNSNRILSYCSLHFFRFFKKRSITRRPTYFSHHYNFYGSKKQLIDKNFSPIYIDQLYSVEAESSLQAKKIVAYAETSSSSSTSRRGKQVADDERASPRKEDKAKEKEKEKVLYSIEDAWREVVAKSPQLRPVDDRAEEFISNFRQDIKIQREKSIVEFEEMLARGT